MGTVPMRTGDPMSIRRVWCNDAGGAETARSVRRSARDEGHLMDLVKIATWSEVGDREPVGVTVDGIDLVIVRQGQEHSVLYGRCLHRGALLADGHVQGD